MPTPNALQQFVDDELLRAPLVIEQTVEAVLEQLRKNLPGSTPTERAMAADLVQALSQRRPRLIEEFLRTLRRLVQATLANSAPAATRNAVADGQALSLVDEAEVTADVEMSHAVEAIKSVAEYELRELQTYTSALVGDMDVSSDHNPMRPETHVQALWAAAQLLTPSRGFQVHFMRQAGMPMAQVLRKSYAAACSRLEAAGVEPAAYRTLILPAGTRTDRTHEAPPAPDLQQIRASMPMPVPAPAIAENAGHPVDQQLIELLSRLFDAILADRKLAPDLQLLLSRLQASALRVVLRDASALDDYSHPLWLLINQIAFQAETLPALGDAERSRMLRHAQGIVEHVIGEPTQDANLYRWALGRLQAYEHNRLERRAVEAMGQIAALQQLEDRLGATLSPPSTFAGALDIAQLDTVPAELYDAAAPTTRSGDGENDAWLNRRQAGDWLRVVLQGQWVQAQLLWPGERGEIWLLADSAGTQTWAVRRGALLALRAARLLDKLEPRSLVRDAARQVLRRLQPPSSGS